MLEKTEGTIKNWQSSILTTCIIPTLLTLFPFPLFILFKLSFKTTFNSVFFSFYVILYRIRKEHYSSTYLLLYHCANDWFFGQLHKCSLHHKNMRLCEVKTIFEGNLVLLYKIYTVSKKCVLRVSIPTVFFVVEYPVLYWNSAT